MRNRDVVCVGASAGGVEALARLAASLPADFPAAILMVLHVSPSGKSVLPSILERAGSLPAHHAVDGEPLKPGQIYVAPPDMHLLVDKDVVRVVRGPRENGHRPAIDPLFRTASETYGNRVIGVVLTGSLDDGSAGARTIRANGGITIVQDPDDALYAAMPLSAIERDDPDHIVAVAEMAALLDRLTAEEIDDIPLGDPEEMVGMEREPVSGEIPILGSFDEMDRTGERTALTCPECGGSLWEHQEGELIRFRCHVGHAYSADSMLAEHTKAVEAALWIALRSLEERIRLCVRLGERLREHGRAPRSALRYEKRAREASEHAAMLREVLDRGISSISMEETSETQEASPS